MSEIDGLWEQQREERLAAIRSEVRRIHEPHNVDRILSDMTPKVPRPWPEGYYTPEELAESDAWWAAYWAKRATKPLRWWRRLMDYLGLI